MCLLQSEDLDFGPTPPDISSSVLSFLPPVIFDSTPWGYNFGDCIQQPPASVKIGDTVRVKFVSDFEIVS